MASDPTELYLPPSFPYPIKIISIDAQEASNIQRGTRLLSYSFVYLSRTAPPDAQPETRFGTWDAAIEGTVDKWSVKPGDVVSQKKARERPVVLVTEPCKHGMQLGGLCVLCGKDMTNVDYTGFSDASRASIQMTHSAFGPTVSLEEAQRIERETAKSLLKSRKLSLIVDLDQTIVHATVDPTVGEWIAEGEAWEVRQQKRLAAPKEKKPQATDDSEDTDSDSESDDECNPNWEALKDVKKFRLGPESFQAPSRGPAKQKNAKQTIENEGCMYYIKPRPGWKDFLRETAAKYEMHVYTMGTRAYAEEVCAAIDPDGSIFGGRVLSRDESGSLTQKSLQRLFPCDTSMVVIIDDRADVWEWSPNLIKVIPYDFYVGIGDINSTFLPKVEPLVPSLPPGSRGPSAKTDSKVTPDPVSSAKTPIAISSEVATKSKLTPSEPLVTTDVDQAKLEADAMIRKNSLELEAQLEERPLAKKQEALSEGEPPLHHHHHHRHEHKDKDKAPDDTANTDAETTAKPPVPVEQPLPPHQTEKVVRKALLNNEDYELQRVKKLLDEMHDRFFVSYEASGKKDPSSKAKQAADVTRIIPQMRADVLSGVHILFSSVIPLDTRPETTEVWKMAHMFGAKCSTELSSEITHVVAAKRGTVKVDTARKRGGIKIVWLQWFTDCIAQWCRLNESSYLLDPEHAHTTAVHGTTTPPTDPHQISSDPEPDGDDWDQDPPAENTEGQGLGLELTSINWDDVNAEVDEFLNETDDDDDDGASVKSDNESVKSVGSVNNTPSRKRQRSVTPSSVNGSPGHSDDELRSPLAKRKKLAADRAGYSRLKDSISANDIVNKTPNGSSPPTPISKPDDLMEDVDSGDEEDEEDEEEDFLANAFEEEEWG